MLQILLFAVWTALCCLIQAALILLPGRAKVRFAQFYWRGVCRILRLHVRRLGSLPRHSIQPVVYVANHSTWLDIPVLGGCLPACFVSKAEVKGWPGIGLIARLGRSVFVSRVRGRTVQELAVMQNRMRDGDDLILFPEGTSSDGVRVLPFRSSFFSLAEGADPPLIQPVSVVYDRMGHLPVLRGNRSVFAWCGAMDLAPHLWRFLGRSGLRVTVLFHCPLDPAHYACRKALAHACWVSVAQGAARLRQNRLP